MNNIILVLIVIAIAVLAVWIYLISNLVKESKNNRSRKKVSEEAAHLSRQAKLEAQERMTKAVEKEYASLQKSLQTEADSASAEFKKGIHEITSKNLKEFNATLQEINTAMKKEVKVLAEASQKQSLLTKKSLDDETAKIKAKVVEQIDNNIAEIMVSYLAEVAGDLDYYQQKDYLYKALEANKQAIKKDIDNAV